MNKYIVSINTNDREMYECVHCHSDCDTYITPKHNTDPVMEHNNRPWSATSF